MGIIASINFKPTKNPVQVFHNDRSTPPNYLLSKERQLYTICNRSGLEAQVLKQQMIDKAISAYIQRVGQKFQAKTYVYSAVVNLKPTHTMQDLEKLATHFKNKYGIQCYQIAIHRDEGHIDEFGNTHINHHAHMEFVTLDENTGKNNFKRVPSLMLKQIQTEVATILDMQRGIDKRISGAKRVEPRAYAKLMEQEKTRRKELARVHQEQLESLQTNTENQQTELHTLQQEKTTLKQANTALTQDNQKLKDNNTELETTLIDLATLVVPQDKQTKKLTIKEAKPLLESIRKQMIAINQGLGDLKLFTQEDYKALRALKDEGLNIDGLKKRITQIEQEAKERYQALQEQYKDYLSPKEVQELQQEHSKELENKSQDYKRALEAIETTHAKEIQTLQAQHAKELEGSNSVLKTEAKLQEYIDKVKALLQRFVDQVINPVLDKLQTEKGAELEAVIQWKKENEREKAEYHAYLAALADSLLAGKFSTINAMAKLFGKGVRGASSKYFESIAKDRRDRFLRQHISEIEKKLNQELKPLLAGIEKAREWGHKDLLAGLKWLESGIEKLAEEFKNSDEYGKMLETAKRDAQYYKNRNLKLTTELEEKDKKIKTLEEENTKLRSTDLRLENDSQKTKIAELENQVESLQTQKDDLQGEQDKLQIELTNTQTQLNEQVAITTQLKADLAKSLASQQGKGRGI
ncbi:hypothetical protein NHP200010_04340 [Helicobacter bizzozeronii]|uniref:hypothetical protein n=1 Tax=Helicobacter bizzozeronii TaxID=56877 RepID=UPI00244D7EB1|nr:hypothetical protein [Helicobacter bizzozeronii]GMB92723.1 hypothetical protein NHP200010_04340 [Helicobacter bizzozeronii]